MVNYVSIPVSMQFAIEMVRIALQHPDLPPRYQLRNMWGAVDIKRRGGISYEIKTRLWGGDGEIRTLVVATCHVQSGHRLTGTCIIELPEELQPSWRFECETEDSRMIATIVSS